MSGLDVKTREEISQLLPWYANGTLDEKEAERVESALDSDDLLKAEFDLILEDQAATIDLVAQELIPDSMSERFKVALHQEQMTPAAAPTEADSSNAVGFLERVVSVLFPTRPVAYMAVAAALLLVVQSGAIVSLIADTPSGGQYQTASGPASKDAGKVRFLVQFNGAANLDLVSSYLSENQGRITAGPSADGLYTLEFPDSDETGRQALQVMLEQSSYLFDVVLMAN